MTADDCTFDVLIERDGDAWVTYVPALNNLSTFGDTRDQALVYTKEAIIGYMKALEREGLDLPNKQPDRQRPGCERVQLLVLEAEATWSSSRR